VPVTVDDAEYRFVSVDDHVVEHPTVWTDRMSRATWGDRVPHVAESDGGQVWVIDGQAVPIADGAVVGALLRDPAEAPRRFAEVPSAATDPAARLHAMDTAGVDTSVLFPWVAGTAGQTLATITDPDLELACVRAYNDWLVDEWAAASPRFVPQCLVPLSSVEAAVAELERAAGRGHRGLVFPALPMFLRDAPEISDGSYGRLWEACASLSMPLALHCGSTPLIQAPAYQGFAPPVSAALDAVNRPFSSALVIASVLLSQMLVPHPGLQVLFPEDSVGWGVFTLETMDYLVQVDRLNVDTYRLLPSEVFARQCYFVGGFEPFPTWAGEYLPASRVLWATNFPSAASPWPDLAGALEKSTAGVTEADRRSILGGNAASLYRING
jgi:predicted TIM-barrel fold metal-dependent hydrolase